ncbi:Type I restriction and modification enzyme-subunit R C terminal [Hathewaya proteolytica DSM 3090]|uniref:Type I restriction and modification enzyme-subunit R C terminal n=1 Tax=Hathewaya proteolytica DSM 3090 TaxID=1121331 RepID=A0A1M6RC94_9CLOT|nr:hypothetical protein [Hathewaya proteolytica]SHK30073.1 Type I restriction and modification enzyme-subunit R C terminal [Hathewaya proteolytica DSM 3090]
MTSFKAARLATELDFIDKVFFVVDRKDLDYQTMKEEFAKLFVNLDYILELIFEKHKNVKDKETLVDEIRRIIRSSTGNRAKESLIVDFINQTNLDEIQDKASIIDAFFLFAQKEQKKEAEELINSEELNVDAAKRYIIASLKREYASENGTELNEVLPKMSPLNPKYLTKKHSVFQKIAAFVEKFKGVGGKL